MVGVPAKKKDHRNHDEQSAQTALWRIAGVDLTRIDGLDRVLAPRVWVGQPIGVNALVAIRLAPMMKGTS